jgi:hypothetical protein
MVETTSDATQRHWVTTASPTIEAVINPLAAACTEAGYIPSDIRILDNPAVREDSKQAADLLKHIVKAHSGEEPTVEFHTIDSERDFEDIVAYHRESIQEATQADTPVAIDVTPGRKFMSALAFQAGIQFDADHVYYLYLHSSDYYDRVYPDLPRPGVDLVDFVEVF